MKSGINGFIVQNKYRHLSSNHQIHPANIIISRSASWLTALRKLSIPGIQNFNPFISGQYLVGSQFTLRPFLIHIRVAIPSCLCQRHSFGRAGNPKQHMFAAPQSLLRLCGGIATLEDLHWCFAVFFERYFLGFLLSPPFLSAFGSWNFI